MAFKNLFRSSPKPSDGLTQSAREAIVDVLHFCMYADKHLAVSEDDFIERAARTLNWDANIAYEAYESKSTGAVTRALGDVAARADFLKSVKSRLPGASERDLALRLANDLMKTDGTKTPAEAQALAELHTLLK